MPYRTLLVDDESLALSRLERLLQPHADQVKIIGQAHNGEEAVAQIDTAKPDLVFLDIHMPGLDGFGVLEQIEHLPWILFCTAYDQYALSAFETHAIDYLLKPVSPERLAQSLEKVERLNAGADNPLRHEVQALLAELRPAVPKRLQVRIGDRIRFIDPRDIYFFRAADKYVEGHTYEESFLFDQSLNQLQDALHTADFTRTHRSTLVNLNHIDEVIRKEGSTYIIRMKNAQQSELPLSRNAKTALGL